MRNDLRTTRWAARVGFALIGALSISLRAAPKYSVVDLGPLTQANAINASGEVVGSIQSGDHTDAFLFSQGQLIKLATLGGTGGYATGINSAGIAVGLSLLKVDSSARGRRQAHAFRYDHGKLEDLTLLQGALGDESLREAKAINDGGQIIGQDDRLRPILYSNGKTTRLDGFDNGFDTMQINAAGSIIGVHSDGGHRHGVLLSGGRLMDLGTLGGTRSVALGINTAGDVVGSADTVTGSHAFLVQAGKMRDLGVPAGWASSAAYGINDRGQIVGMAENPVKDDRPIPPGVFDQGVLVSWRAFLYDHGRWIDLNAMTDLASVGFTELTRTAGINNAGQIIGQASGADHRFHAFLLTPMAKLSE